MDSPTFLEQAITSTSAPYPVYRGKVRDRYDLNDTTVALVATDRISAFDHILPQPIPFKGQILNSIATHFFNRVVDLVPIHIIDTPHPNVVIAKKCEVIPIEVVIRGYLTGHAARVYASGKRELCGVSLPEGMKENQAFNAPILTPATKAEEGHDEDISEHDLLEQNIVSEEIWETVRSYAFKLFERGTKLANERGLILVDTKYEFGLFNGEVTLIDEVHTPDSSRYFFSEDYKEAFNMGKKPKQLSKEFVREWLLNEGFQGLEGQTMPNMPPEFVHSIYTRYSELYMELTGHPFQPTPTLHFDTELATILSRFE